MKLTSAIVSLFALLVISACNPANKYEKELAQIDSGMVVLDTIEMQLNSIEFDSLQMMVDHVIMNEDTLKKYYDPDTLSLYVGMRMQECKGIKKTMRSLNLKEEQFNTELSAQRLQFKNLRNDIENGVLKEDKINEYLNQEMINLNALNESFTEFYYTQKTNKRYYYFSVPVVDSLIVELKNEYTVE